MEATKEMMEYLVDLGLEANHTEVLEICGKTYANKKLNRYDTEAKASPIQASTLSSLVDYIKNCSHEFKGRMIIHIVSPTKVNLVSELDQEREREILFSVQAEISGFRFDEWYKQDRFMIELQANFIENEDLNTVMKLAGNIEKKNEQTFSDDGRTQLAIMTVGVASKADVIVPNPVELIPYRTFMEIKQPISKFVFRIEDKGVPNFKIVEAEGGIWRNTAIEGIKQYFQEELFKTSSDLSGKVLVIG